MLAYNKTDFTPDYVRMTASYVGWSIKDLDLQDWRWQLIR